MAWATRVLTPRDLQLLFRVLECVDTLLQLRHGCRKSFSAVSNSPGLKVTVGRPGLASK